MPQQVETIARLALSLANKYMSLHGAFRSRRDFTQARLTACLMLRAYGKTTYRGLVETLSGQTRLRKVLDLEEKLPHCPTVQKFSERSQVPAILNQMRQSLGKAALRQEKSAVLAAMDSTGVGDEHSQCAFDKPQRETTPNRWVKVSVIVPGGSLRTLRGDRVTIKRRLRPCWSRCWQGPNRIGSTLMPVMTPNGFMGFVGSMESLRLFKPARFAADGTRSGGEPQSNECGLLKATTLWQAPAGGNLYGWPETDHWNLP